jgi:hypothetical protein
MVTIILLNVIINKRINMKILFLSEDGSVFDDNSLARARILEYASIVSMFFVVVATNFNKKSIQAKEITQNTWIYQTNSVYKFLHIWDIFKLASSELQDKNIFQADVIVCEGGLTSVLAGYFLSKKFKRPLYIFFSEASEKKFLAPAGLKNFLLSKIMWFVLTNTDYIKVDNFETKEKLRKKFALKDHTIQVIKPFIGADMLLASSRSLVGEERIENSFIKRRFPEFKFTIVTFVDNINQAKLSLDILKKLNEHFPPTSLILLPSYNLKSSQVNHFIKRNLKPFVRIESIDENLCEYLVSANIFFGLSEGEKYEEILNKACAVGATIIALEGNVSKRLIEDNATGFICSVFQRQEMIDYFVSKTLFLMNNPAVSTSFKINVAYSFKQHFNSTNKEYLEKLKLSWKECLEKYKKSRLKFFRY